MLRPSSSLRFLRSSRGVTVSPLSAFVGNTFPKNVPKKELLSVKHRRFFSQERDSFSSKNGDKRLYLLGVGAVALAAGVGFAYIPASAEEAPVDYDKVRKDIEQVIDVDENRGPTLVRLAWHGSGTYSKLDQTGGSDGGRIRFVPEKDWGANAGLHLAREWLEPVKQKHPGISYADLYTLAAVVAIEKMNGPKINWRPGRTDDADGSKSPTDVRLPDADKGSKPETTQHIRDVFYRMGFDDREIVCLVGAHALGRCHKDRSGYDGPWTKAPTMFSNEYYRELIENTWTLKKWDGPEQYEDKSGELMMLPADMALLWDPTFKKYVKMYAEDEELFFKDFAQAFQKLEELGVKKFNKGWFSWLWGN